MAGDWIKFELATLDKPEVCQLADLANCDMDAVVGKLLRVWGWFDQHTEDGNAPSVSKRLLDRMVGVNSFCEFMKSVGWMFEEDGVISLPRFDRHNGKTAKNRLLTAKRVANHKAANAKGNAEGNGQSVSGALPREDVEKNKSKDQEHDGAPSAPPVAAAPVPTGREAAESDHSRSKRGSRLPADWSLPTEWAEWAAADRPEFTRADIARVAESFADYWHAATRNATKLDWQATWRNWFRNQRAPINNVRQFPGQSRHVGLTDRFVAEDVREDGTHAF